MAYDHFAIEQRWQQYWEEHQVFRTERRKGHPKYYVLDMFPYPSGQGLHVGHPEGYTATDIIARYKRMLGFDVLHPMGWDAFGLPAEQHAIATGTHPADTTKANIATFRRQLRGLGFSYDWSREIDTTDPGYVRWTQWIFLQLFQRGLALQSEIPVNWCPALGTVLANEEVINGLSERGGHPVVRQPLRQWQLKITKYADRLAEDLAPLDWPETKLKQTDWIGRSVGAEVRFSLEGKSEVVSVFTTRPDTLFGVSYLVVAPDHPLIRKLTSEEQLPAVLAYAEQAARKSDLERTSTTKHKSGVFIGCYAVNPVNGERVPVYTSDYVLGSYGTGAVMAVPAHDVRDFEFAQAFGLPIVEVVSPDGTLHEALRAAYTEPGIMVHCGAYDGLPSEEFKARIVDELAASGAATKQVNYKLRDWVFSRQRYWGEPIPIYFPVKTDGDPRRGAAYEIDYTQPFAVEDSELPLSLPDLIDFKPSNDPSGPLARALDWRFFQKDGQWFARETNTMPQWAGSCWYYLRYLDPTNSERIFSEQAYDDWMPVDLYVGGAEHAVLHLLYARFWHKVLFDVGIVKHPEPFTKLVHQGFILGQSYRYFETTGKDGKVVSLSSEAVKPGPDKGTYVASESGLPAKEVLIGQGAVQRDGKPVHAESGVALEVVFEKMSKSRGNVVNPDEVVAEYGADALRIYEMFMGPLERTKPWQMSGLSGVRGFLDKLYNVVQRGPGDQPMDSETAKLTHRTVKKVAGDIEGLRFNTAVSQMMILTNHLSSLGRAPRAAVEPLVLCLSPFAPHLAEQLWVDLGNAPSLARCAWPAWDEALCEDDVIEMPVQVNGRVRGRVVLRKDADEAEARELGLQDEKVQAFMADKALVKVVFVPGRILNFIVK